MASNASKHRREQETAARRSTRTSHKLPAPPSRTDLLSFEFSKEAGISLGSGAGLEIIQLQHLPEEIGVYILSWLDVPELLNASQVCHFMRRWAIFAGLTIHEFKYSRDWDDNGILYWIGSNGKTSSFTNPALTGVVKVGASHQFPNFVGRTPFWVKNVGDAIDTYYEVDFGPNRLINPTGYTITYGNDGSGWEPRNWKLIGSNDRIHWTLLKDHHNDTSLNGVFSSASWKLEPRHTTAGTTTIRSRLRNGLFSTFASHSHSHNHSLNGNRSCNGCQSQNCGTKKPTFGFRYFRLVQTGKNKTGYYTFFVCCFELYGTLYYNSREGKEAFRESEHSCCSHNFVNHENKKLLNDIKSAKSGTQEDSDTVEAEELPSNLIDAETPEVTFVAPLTPTPALIVDLPDLDYNREIVDQLLEGLNISTSNTTTDVTPSRKSNDDQRRPLTPNLSQSNGNSWTTSASGRTP